MNDHLRYHGYDGVAGVVAKAGFKASNLATVVHRGIFDANLADFRILDFGQFYYLRRHRRHHHHHS